MRWTKPASAKKVPPQSQSALLTNSRLTSWAGQQQWRTSAMRMQREFRVFSTALMMGLAVVPYGQSPETEAGNLTGEVTALKTENIALREQLNRVEDQQKMLLEVVNDLKQ